MTIEAHPGFTLEYKGKPEQPMEIGADGMPELWEWTTYILMVEGYDVDNIPGLSTVITQAQEERPALAEVSFNNYIGATRIYGKKFRVRSKKIDLPTFNRMLAEVSSEVANLPFDFNTPTFLPFVPAGATTADILYQQFAYLRHVILYDSPSLREEYRAIEANPHRRFVRTSRKEEISRVRSVRPAAILDAVARAENLVRVGEGHRAFGFPVSMAIRGDPEQRAVPISLLDDRVDSSFDNPENRFVKRFIKNATLVAERFKELLHTSASQERLLATAVDLLEEAEGIIKILDRMARSEFLSDVGELQRLPMSSQVLHKSEGYRQFLAHYHKMALSPTFPVSSDSVRRILESKDVATLYEYWCFFVIAGILADRLGKCRQASIEKSGPFRTVLKHGIRLKYPENVELQFNRGYRGNSSRSYSVNLRPDISLKVRDRLHLFDAKFKYDQENPPFKDEGLPEDEDEVDGLEEEEDLKQVFKRVDLYKMHTYKDAIVDAQDVWILYPGTEFRFFEEGRGRLSSIEEIGNLTGVGAVPLKPLGDTRLLDKLVTRIIG